MSLHHFSDLQNKLTYRFIKMNKKIKANLNTVFSANLGKVCTVSKMIVASPYLRRLVVCICRFSFTSTSSNLNRLVISFREKQLYDIMTERKNRCLGRSDNWRSRIHILDELSKWSKFYERRSIEMERKKNSLKRLRSHYFYSTVLIGLVIKRKNLKAN